MHYDIAAFTHTGTVRPINQDRILVQDDIALDGFCEVRQADSCFCFVADGIGGNNAGERAAQFVLEHIRDWRNAQESYSETGIRASFDEINDALIAFGKQQREYCGLSTTLAGVMIREKQFFIVNAGDSPVWLFRNDLFYQLTENQVIDPYENNSPLLSYFGGQENNLDLCFCSDVREIRPDDFLLLCSDGLFKSLKPKQVKAVVSNNQAVEEKIRFLRHKILETGAEDNVSCILIHVLMEEVSGA